MQRWRTAFTLVELLVVVGVIAVLIGILMPVVNRSRAMAVRATCQANLRSIGVCLRAYLNDNRDIMPLACAYPWVIIDPTNANYTPPITNFLGPLLREPQVFICKADTVHKYYLRVGGMSYYYNGSRQTPTGWTNGLGGAKISMSSLALSGVTERNINVMSDFDSVHPVRGQYGGVNYLYADWHVADYQNQD
jgi:prepilin-type processing-associated H-X9-DG protein/prepilin-type N-terminal cleavage/methylation domain-containing protein